MSILHLIETGGPGGAEQMLLRLAEEYRRRGLSQVVCLRKDGWLAAEVRQRGFPLEIIPLRGLPDPIWLWQLRRLVKVHNVSAVHAHEFAMNVRGALLSKWLGINSVATVHGKGYFGDKLVRRLAYRVASRLTNIVAVSDDIRNHLINKVGMLPGLVSVIANGVDTAHFRFNIENRRKLRAQYGVQDDQLLLGTVGSYYPVKGHCYLIDAMQKLLNINNGIKLVMAGQGPLDKELQIQIHEKCLGTNVQLVGYVEDTSGFLSALDIFVMPSLSEGQPLALLEAAANGRCIVATNVGGIPEIISDHQSGILVSPADSEALANVLAKLICEPELRRNLGNAAMSMVNDNWSIQQSADRYLSLLLPAS